MNVTNRKRPYEMRAAELVEAWRRPFAIHMMSAVEVIATRTGRTSGRHAHRLRASELVEIHKRRIGK